MSIVITWFTINPYSFLLNHYDILYDYDYEYDCGVNKVYMIRVQVFWLEKVALT